MKKIYIILTLVLIVTGICTISRASSNVNINNTNNSVQSGQLVQMKEKTQSELDEYIEKYGSESYGLTAFVLKKVQVYSIPLCFLGVAISAIYQYIIGIRKLDTRDKGFYSLVGFVTIFVICQVLPLVFAIVIKGWRG